MCWELCRELWSGTTAVGSLASTVNPSAASASTAPPLAASAPAAPAPRTPRTSASDAHARGQILEAACGRLRAEEPAFRRGARAHRGRRLGLGRRVAAVRVGRLSSALCAGATAVWLTGWRAACRTWAKSKSHSTTSRRERDGGGGRAPCTDSACSSSSEGPVGTTRAQALSCCDLLYEQVHAALCGTGQGRGWEGRGRAGLGGGVGARTCTQGGGGQRWPMKYTSTEGACRSAPAQWSLLLL